MESDIPGMQRQKSRRKERMDQLREKLKKLQAMESSASRKARNGQLIAFGVFLEWYLGSIDSGERTNIETKALDFFGGKNDERNLARFSDGLNRILAAKGPAK